MIGYLILTCFFLCLFGGIIYSATFAIADLAFDSMENLWLYIAWARFTDAKETKQNALHDLREGYGKNTYHWEFHDEQSAKDGLRQAVNDRFWYGLLVVALAFFWYVVIPAQVVYAGYTALVGKSAERKEINKYLKAPATPQDRVD